MAAPAADLDTLLVRLEEWWRPDDPNRLAEHFREADAAAAAQAADGSWSDIDYACRSLVAWSTQTHLRRLVALAFALRFDASAPVRRAARFEAARRAIDYWTEHDFQNPANWWWTQIGAPMAMAQALVLLRRELDPERLREGLRTVARSHFETRVGERTIRWTGANLSWMAANRLVGGALERDAGKVAACFERLYAEIVVAPLGAEGLQADLSFHQHGPLLYTGGYGVAFMQDGLRAAFLAHGTRFEMPSATFGRLAAYILDGQQWTVRGRVFDYGVTGRELTRAGKDALPLLPALRRIAELDVPRRAEFAQFAARLAGDHQVPPLTGSKHFWRSDHTVHHRPAFYASARTHSARTKNTELCNGEGLQSHLLADGATFILRDGEEYRDIFPAWDWKRVPGVTALHAPEPLDPKQVGRVGTNPFAGGASDGTSAVATLRLERGGLRVLRAWVFLDDGFVALGAGLACAEPHPVRTSLNQCLLRGPVYAGDLAQALPHGEHDLAAARWLWHDGIGYVPLAPAAWRAILGPQTGSWQAISEAKSPRPVTHEIFGACLEHGVAPQEVCFAYAVRPGIEPAALAAWASGPTWRVLENTEQRQAVFDPRAKLLAAVFHAPGALDAPAGWRLQADRPCVALLRETTDGLRLTAAQPAQESGNLRLALDRPNANGQAVRELILPEGWDAGRGVTVAW
ncbi:MAG: chloramphenicol resistance protein [Planctomycetota bacterium]